MSPIYSTRFHIDRARKRLSVDVSDFGRRSPFQRVYEDACDQGLRVESALTHKVSTWVVADAFGSLDGIEAWLLKPTPETLRSQPELNGWTMKIFND